MVIDDNKKKIVIIGAGNVATHLSKALDVQNDVIAVFSRSLENAETLAKCLKCAKATKDLSSLPDNADFYLISIKDDLIGEVARAVKTDSWIWAHTSGTVPADVFKGIKTNYGVFYPLQTFNKSKSVDVSKVPMFIEGSDANVTEYLVKLAESISSRVSEADSQARKRFHLAAVFACNFVNRLWGIADEILRDGGFDLSILDPLMHVSLENALRYRPENVQTGPAKRGDMHVIESQVNSIEDERIKEIYKLITLNIIDKYKDK